MKINFGNLKYNWYLPISAMALFCLNLSSGLGYLFSLPISFAFSIAFAAKIPPLWDTVRQTDWRLSVISFLTALGTCWGTASGFYGGLIASRRVRYLDALFSDGQKVLFFLAVLGCVSAICFAYCCAQIFWKKMADIISEIDIFRGITPFESVIYGVFLIASLCFTTYAFLHTNAFYGANSLFDVIYTGDSACLVEGNAYLYIMHSENDLRQPLFAVFSAPFISIPYLLGVLLGNNPAVNACLMNAMQIIMLFAAHFMLAKLMKLNPAMRICFLLLTSCTYTHLLFCLMMEQYIIAYFWLVFCLYLICETKNPHRIALWGAGGTLLTSMVLLPFLSNKHPLKDFKGWFADCLRTGLVFIALLLLFFRFDIFYNLSSLIAELLVFSGKGLTFSEKLLQYLSFISGCFLAPNAGVNTTAFNHISWQLHPVNGISIAGTLIFILAIISAFVNRDKKSSRFAIGWVAFSVFMLLIFGWGTKENGLILYALYFGWAFFVLLFQFVLWLEEKFRIPYLAPIVSIGCAVFLLTVNIPAILELVRFAVTYYPV